MTSVESAHHFSCINALSHQGQQHQQIENNFLDYNTEMDAYRNSRTLGQSEKSNDESTAQSNSSDPSAVRASVAGQITNTPPPRFEAYTMTGNHILAKTNNRNPSDSKSRNSSSNVRTDLGPSRQGKSKVISPTNIVLHSPPLNTRKSPSLTPSPAGEKEAVDGLNAGSSANKPTNQQENTFVYEYSTHDLHGFTLSTVVNRNEDPHRQSLGKYCNVNRVYELRFLLLITRNIHTWSIDYLPSEKNSVNKYLYNKYYVLN